MASQPRSREQGRRLSVRTLAIGSIASVTAAIATSRFWIAGTPLAAAATPVIVALVSELLHRPADAAARRLSADRPALPAAAAGGASLIGGDAPVTLYGRRRRVRRKLAFGAVAATAVLSFAVAAAAMTLPELIVGESIGKGDRQTTLFGGKQPGEADAAPTTTTETTPETETETTPETVTETTPETVTETTPAPQQQPRYRQQRPTETLPQAPGAQPTETTPTPTQTAPSPAQQP